MKPSNPAASASLSANRPPSGKLRAVAATCAGWLEKRTADLVPYYYHALTGALQWDKPAELEGGGGCAAAAAASHAGLVWVPDEIEGYVCARSLGGKSYQALDGRMLTFTAPKGRSLDAVNFASLSMLHDDLVLLDNLSDGMILHNLRERFLKDQIYCGVGSILIALNPFKRLPLYTPDIIEKCDGCCFIRHQTAALITCCRYNKRGNRVLPPHPFGIADAAYKALLEVQ